MLLCYRETCYALHRPAPSERTGPRGQRGAGVAHADTRSGVQDPAAHLTATANLGDPSQGVREPGFYADPPEAVHGNLVVCMELTPVR